MARPTSEHVARVKQKLIVRLTDGLCRTGDRFFSIRGVATHFGVSYQTADRLLRALTEEGHLVRRPGAGTYVVGPGGRPATVKLIFCRRARRAGSFGGRLIETIEENLRREGIAFVRAFPEPGRAVRVSPTEYPVLWESPAAAAALTRQGRPMLLLNDRPAAGLGALVVDSIAVDDALGGTCAGELIRRRVGRRARVGVLAGPREDRRSHLRVAGFTGHCPDAVVVHAPTWFLEDALGPARDLLATKPEAVFACNDRLAQAVLETAATLGLPTPVLFGFDDAPVAESLHLSTIAIPWVQLAAAVVTVVRWRLGGDKAGASHLELSPQPVVRLT